MNFIFLTVSYHISQKPNYKKLGRASFSQSKDSAWIFASLIPQGELKKAKKWRQAFLILPNGETRAQWWNAVRTPKRCADQKRRTAGCRFHNEDPKRKKAIAAYSILQNSVKECQLLIFPELNILTISTLRQYFLGAGDWQLFGMRGWEGKNNGHWKNSILCLSRRARYIPCVCVCMCGCTRGCSWLRS